MKKILMVVAFALTAIGSYAAATDWALTCGNMKDHTGNAFAGSYVLYATGGDLASDLIVYSTASASATFNKFAITVDSGLTPDQTYSFYYVLTDKDGYTFTSDNKGPFAALATGTQTIAFNNQATATGSGTWKPAAAPEPTSAMLLLLGMAGLALKRKVA